MKTFRDLKVWQRAHTLVLEVHKVTSGFPAAERYGLTSQMRRAIISVAANIVEGFKRRSKKDFQHFLNMADGSLEESKYYFILSHDLSYLSDKEFNNLNNFAEETGKMLNGLYRKLGS